MSIIFLGIGTILTLIWLILIVMVNKDDWISAAYAQVVDNRLEIERLKLLDEKNAKKLSKYHGITRFFMGIFIGKKSDKKIKKLEKNSENLQNGKLGSLRIIDMPGYVLLRKIDAIGHGEINKIILSKCTELYGKKYAPNKTKQLLARLTSYAIIGVAMSLNIGGLVLILAGGVIGLVVALVGTGLVVVLVYAMYDEIGDRVSKRRQAIARQFPNVVSKLALLTTSGMIMDRAWRETAFSNEGELYREMRITSDELSNLVAPVLAYTNFINRTNTKETTKLGSAISQNQTKSNSEIGILLRNMAHEAWQERRHGAKRASEAANSKLMIPTMMLLLAIMVLIMVPVALNFSSL